MKIQILGTGCSKCKKLAENAQTAINETGITAELVKVEDVREIMKFNILMTPGLAIDGDVKSAGRVLPPAEIKKILLAAGAVR